MVINVPAGPVKMSILTEDERILSGVLRHVRESATVSHAALPGELKLAEWLGCTRQQVRQALAQLERQGIVKRSQGAPTTVDPVALRLSARFEARVEYSEVLARMGYTPSVEVLSAQVVPMPEEIAPLLTSDASDSAILIALRWYADGQPAMVAEYTLPLPEGDRPEITPTDSVFESAKALWGEGVAWEIVTAGVGLLDDHYGQLMHLQPGTVAKTWEVIGVTLSGRRIFHALEHHHPDLVMYTFVRGPKAAWGNIPGE